MVTNRFNISTKFENGDVPSQSDFVEIFNSFVHKDEDKANIQMVEAGIDNERYVTPALLNAGLKNIGIITGNCYMPHKETFESTFSGTTLPLEKNPIQYSVKVFKNGQLLQEGPDYTVNYNTAIITFSDEVTDRNLEINYWYKNFSSNPGNGGEAIDFTNFLHTTGNETKKGILTFNNATPTSTSGIVLTNSGVGTTATALDISVSGTGKGIALQNSSTGTGIKVSNTGTGTGLHLNSSSTSTGDPLKVTKDDIVKAKIDVDGNVTAKRFISSNGVATEFVKGDGSLDPTTYADNTKVIHNAGNEERDGALKLTHDSTPPEDVLTITKNNSANCLKLVQNSNSDATTSTFDTTTANVNRKAISIRKIDQENAFITHEGNVTATSFTSSTLRADITDGLLTIASSDSPTPSQGQAKLYAKTNGTTDMYVMGSDGVEKKIGAGSGGDLDNVLHKTGFATETKTGELVIDSGTAEISGLKLSKFQTLLTNAEIVHSSPIYSRSRGIAKDNMDNIYIGTLGGLFKMLPDESVSLLSATSSGQRICVDNLGNVYTIPFTSLGFATPLYKTTPLGIRSTVITDTLLSSALSVCIGNDGALYIPSGYGLIRVTNDGLNISVHNSTVTTGDITTDESGNFYLPKASDNTIIKITVDGLTVSLFATGIPRPSGITRRLDGSFLVTDYNKNKIFSISTSGVVSEISSSSLLSFPNDIVETISGIYISQLDGSIIKLPAGSNKVLKTDSTGLVVKTTYLEDAKYLKASDVDLTNLVAKNSIKTINGISLLGSGDIVTASIEPTQITITTTVNITTDTVDTNNKNQIGKNVIINNGVTAISITVNGGTDFSASYLKHGTGAITFVQGAGRTLVVVNGTAILNGAAGSTATISSIGTTDYLRISNV